VTHGLYLLIPGRNLISVRKDGAKFHNNQFNYLNLN
jgi:hypothetical protein